MRRKKPEPPPTEGIDEPFEPPPEEYLYRCSVCGEEMLVNEAIIDVGMGMAKFQREYYAGFMPQGGMPRMSWLHDGVCRARALVRPEGVMCKVGEFPRQFCRLPN